MKNKLEIEFLKALPDNQKINIFLPEQLSLRSKSQLSSTRKYSENIISEINKTSQVEVDRIFLNFTYTYNNNTLNSLKEKYELETYSLMHPEDSGKETYMTPCLMLYNVVTSLEKNVIRNIRNDNENDCSKETKNSNSNSNIILFPNTCFLKYSVNQFYVVGWGKTLLLAIVQNGFLYLMNFDFIIIMVIQIKRIKKISLKKKSDIIFHYEEKKQNKCISLLSSFNRNCFIQDLVENNRNLTIEDKAFNTESKSFRYLEREYQKRLLIEILEYQPIISSKNNENICDKQDNQDNGDKEINNTKDIDYKNIENLALYNNRKFEILRKMKFLLQQQCPSSYYKYELTFNMRKSKLSSMSRIENGTFNNILLLLFFYNHDIINSVFSIIHFNYNNLNCDFRNSINSDSYMYFIKSTIKMRRKSFELEQKQKRLRQEQEKLRKMRNRPRKDLEKKRKKINNGKCNFKDIAFQVCLSKNGNFKKESKLVEVSTGSFKYYKDKTNSVTYEMRKIHRLITKYDCYRCLEIIMDIGDDKKEHQEFFFQNPYEKYVFQSLIYNYLVFNLHRPIINNQVSLNCNIMTWNVAGIEVPQDLIPLFNSKSLDKVDILAIGVQECGLFKIKDWMKHLRRLLNYYGFKEVEVTSMFQMFLLVFVKNDLYNLIDDISVETKPMGFAKIIGNKGGMAISFNMAGFRFTILNCHLAPKPHKVLERNKHAKTLVKQIKVGEKICEFDTGSDYVFWMGDMNYRVDYIFKEVLEEISKNNLQLLLTKDQLIRQKQQNQVFTSFQEAEINFWPTYRRVKGTDEYSNKKNQSPSWCDRILVKSDRFIDILFYDSIQEVNLSDHLPVLSKFSLYLTAPIIEDVEKLTDQKIQGTFCFSDIQVKYNFTEGLSELDVDLLLPAKVKLSIYYFVNEKKTESQYLLLKEYEDFEILEFEDLYVQCPPQFIFDFPHAKAMSFYFVLTMVNNNTTHDIGFSKFSLENIETNDLNLLSFSHEVQINFRTRNLGTIIFNSTYKM